MPNLPDPPLDEPLTTARSARPGGVEQELAIVDGIFGVDRRSSPKEPAAATAEECRGALDRRCPDGLAATRAYGSQSDEELVAALRRGEHSAFDTLAARYGTRLLRFCHQLLRSREDAEDALQDVLAGAFNALLADERAVQVRPWLYRIARNRCINQLRRASAVGLDSMDDLSADGGATVVDKVLTRQNFRDLVVDVKALPDSQRVALLLREIDGFAYERIAFAMDTTVPAVKSLLVRARIGLHNAADIRASGVAAPVAAPPKRRSRARLARADAGPTTYRAALAVAAAVEQPALTPASLSPVAHRSPSGGGRKSGHGRQAAVAIAAAQARRSPPRKSDQSGS
jgi:RNA polymerase sigma factor (sigma-70 family)